MPISAAEVKASVSAKEFIIRGQRPLSGVYPVQGNKNAALPLLAASLLSPDLTMFSRVPRIRDVVNLLRLIEASGASVRHAEDLVEIDPRPASGPVELPDELVRTLRGAILLLGPLAARHDRIRCALPGGCPIGRRSFEAHWSVFRAAGFAVREEGGAVELVRRQQVPHPRVFLQESSVTGTENALLLFTALGAGRIDNPAREPHVLAVIDFLRSLGADIVTHPLYYEVRGPIQRGNAQAPFEVPADYIDAGTMAIAAAVTRGEVTLEGVTHFDLIGIRPFLEEFGVRFEEVSPSRIRVRADEIRNPPQLTAGPWPLFPTDLISLGIVLAIEGRGLCLVHDWMYEARMFFVDKLVRMGARITVCDPHRVMVEGTGRLKGITLESPDIRAGMALLVAGLAAQGTTVIEHGEVVQRGYERVAERLRAIGADIEESGD